MAQRKRHSARHETLAPNTAGSAPWLTRAAQHPLARAVAGVLVLIATVLVVYGPALHAQFIFDDMPTVVRNDSIRRVWPLWGTSENPGPLQPPAQAPVSGRPLVNLSLALNYAFAGVDPFGYHLGNVLLHITSALLLWVMVRRTLTLEYFGGRFANSANVLGWITAMLWAIHPLAIDAVEYVTQRTELLMAFCYLLTFDACWHYWHATSRGARGGWLLLAVGACLAGMAAKEVMVSAPVMVLLYERTFITGSVAKALRRSWPLYTGLALTWGLLALLNISAPRSNTAGFHLDVSPLTWWFTQAKVLLIYLKLVVWPAPLLIYYDIPYIESLGVAIPWLAAVASLAVLTIVLLWRRSAVGFVLTLVFALLSPTLVVPVVTEVAAERRMYLPLAALLALAVSSGYLLAERLAGRRPDKSRHSATNWPLAFVAILSVLVLLIYAERSSRRLADFATPLAIWQAALPYEPDSEYVQNNVGMALVALGRSREAIPHFAAAAQHNPDSVKAHTELGFALIAGGRAVDALEHFTTMAELDPRSFRAQNNLGFALVVAGRPEQALPHLQQACELDPAAAEPHNNLGLAMGGLQRPEEAIRHFQRALELQPNFPDAAANLGIAELSAGRVEQAAVDLEHALQLRPEQFDAVLPLATAYEQRGRQSEAIATVQAAQQRAVAKNRTDEARKFEQWLQTHRPRPAAP